ncbi:MAG TPA: right-handed parallel beta-helix repeat-containing protein [Candidatus Binataceae bacterium]|nr:right-handed parallel beta-helix repeat-containing protein [Candidatus Binataceae bacterium]
MENALRAKKSRVFGIVASIIVVTIGLAISSASAQSQSRSFYVDAAAGNDSNSGANPTSAWRTVAKVNGLAFTPGDTVYFKRGGVWRETIEPSRGGAQGRPVTFTAYGDGPRPVINGSDVITGWTRGESAIFVAQSKKPGNVYVDGTPGWGLLHACCPAGSNCIPSRFCGIGPMREGSWFWNPASNELSIWLPDGGDPNTHLIEAATRPWGMHVVADAGEKSNIVIDGITFERTAGGGLYFYSNDQGGVGSTGIVVRNCTVTQVGTGLVDDGSYFNGIHYSQDHPLPTAPIYEHNRISYTGNHGNSINSQAADNAQILDNECTLFNHHGVDVKQSRGVLIRSNIVHDSGERGVYESNGIFEEYCHDTLITNNLVYNMLGATIPGTGSGIQIDVDSTGARIVNNSIFNVLTGLYLIHPATVQYNAVYNAAHAVLDAKQGGDIAHNVWGPDPTFFVANQRFDAQGWQMAGHSDLIADPMWRDPRHGDFTFDPSSPLIAAHAGITTPLHPTLNDPPE